MGSQEANFEWNLESHLFSLDECSKNAYIYSNNHYYHTNLPGIRQEILIFYALLRSINK
jgi:hypothetical protein